tara:strand:+ start:620 stop:1240 length:621 start_codon:yes stop_codon:yes gene_type:complete
MNPNQIVERILHSKKYRNYPKSFVKRIVLANLSKGDPLKASKLQLHEMSAMFRSLKRGKDVERIWHYVESEVGSFESVLDLGCGRDYEFFKNVDVDYIGVDIDIFDNVIQDDILEPKKDWKNKNYGLVLMLNVIPVLERLEKGSGKRLINYWKGKSRFVVVSFPLYSLGGRNYIGNFWKSYVKENFPEDIIEVIQGDLILVVGGKR